MRAETHRGFSFVDVMVAMAVLLVGVLAFCAALTAAVIRSDESEELMRARQLGSSTLESVFAARDLELFGLGWEAIANDDDPSGLGMFVTGAQPVYDSTGPDGIVGTADDGAGADGVVDTADDLAPLPGLARSITVTRILDQDFTPPADNLKRITVRILYRVNNAPRDVELSTYVARYERE
jgi:hypothetical protein